MKIPKAFSFYCWLGLMLGVLGGGKLPPPATAAETVSFWYSSLEFSVDINDLEKNLEIDLENPIVEIEGNTFTEVNNQVNPINSPPVPKWQLLLTQDIRLDRVTVSRLLNSSLGTIILQSIGEIIRVSPSQNGFYALRSAFVLASSSSESFTLLDVLRQFPADTINIDAQASLKLAHLFGQLQRETQREIAAIKHQAENESQDHSATEFSDFSQQPNVENPGSFTWHQENLALYDQKRDRSLSVAFYRPQMDFNISKKTPLVVISPGFGVKKENFSYLAEHLASYGVAVAILDHPGSDYAQVKNFFAGTTREILTPQELIDRPQDVSYLLDELERLEQAKPSSLGTLDLEKVGIVGHSVGSYTALALGGAKLDIKYLQQYCSTNTLDLNWFNPSMAVQCLAAKLPSTKNYQLGDRRIAAIFAMNPFGSKIFGETGLNQLKIPVVFVGGSKDVFTPLLSEQIEPFAQLGSREKYLLLIDRGTHAYRHTKLLSALAINTGVNTTDKGFNPQLARNYAKAMSLAFMQTYISDQAKYRRFLTKNYAQYISETPMNLNIISPTPIKPSI